jgi:hypothetical protein
VYTGICDDYGLLGLVFWILFACEAVDFAGHIITCEKRCVSKMLVSGGTELREGVHTHASSFDPSTNIVASQRHVIKKRFVDVDTVVQAGEGTRRCQTESGRTLSLTDCITEKERRPTT